MWIWLVTYVLNTERRNKYMTFTKEEIERERLVVDYDDEWQFLDEDKTVDIKFYGFEDRIRKFFGLEDDYGEEWIDCYATIDPVKEYVTEIYMQFTSNCDVLDRELQLKITNKPEAKMLFNALWDGDEEFGGFREFINEAKKEYEE